jgi:hypothetical protein
LLEYDVAEGPRPFESATHELLEQRASRSGRQVGIRRIQLLHLLQQADAATRGEGADLVPLAASVAAILHRPPILNVFGSRDQIVCLTTSHGCRSRNFFISTCSAMSRLLAAQRVVGVKRAQPDTVGGEDDDVVERYLPDVQQRAIDVVGAGLGRTVAVAAVTLGLDLVARRGGIGGFDAYGVTT